MGRDSRLAQRKKVIRLLLLILGIILLSSFGRLFFRSVHLRQEVVRLEREIVAIERRNEQLRQDILHVQSPEYVEQVAREKLGLVRPGETVYRLTEELNPVE